MRTPGVEPKGKKTPGNNSEGPVFTWALVLYF